MVETINSERLATSLNSSWAKLNKPGPLNIMVEVNTSDEESKMGCHTQETIKIVEFIIKNCPNLKFVGLMTIGQYNYDWEKLGPNPDFICLTKCREDICEQFKLPTYAVELSMGMSSDFDKAILMGSTNVRVGSTIFGERDPNKAMQPVLPEERPANNDTKNTNENKPENSLISETSENLGNLSII